MSAVVTIDDLLVELGAHGVELCRAGAELKVRGAVPPELVPHLRAHKAMLLDIAGERWWTPVRRITPAMLPLVDLTQAEVDTVVATVAGGAANVADVYPLAPLQDGVLFHHLVSEGADPYVMSLTFAFDTDDRLAAWVRAFDAVIARHDILRTAVVWADLPYPVQVVWRRASLPVTEATVAGAADPVAGLRAAADARGVRLDLGTAPLARLITAHDGDRTLAVLLLHHLVADHVTLEIVLAEIGAHLRGEQATLPEPVPFRTFVATARGDEDAHRAFFTAMLGDVTEPTAPFGVAVMAGDGTDVTESRLRVDDTVAAGVRARATALGVSSAALCHLAWAHVLARLTGRADVVFGTVLFGRMRGGDGVDRAVGPFINTLPVRVRTGSAVAAEARAVHGTLTDLMRHEHASLALAQRCGGVPAPAPLFTTILNYRHSAAAVDTPAEEGITPLHGDERTNYPLTLSVDDLGSEPGGGFGVTVQAAAGIDPDRVARYVHTALAAVAAGAADLDVLPAGEHDLLVDGWNDTASAVPDALVHELVERQDPASVAVVHGADRVTYGELNARADRVARWLHAQGVRHDERVAVLLPRGVDQLVAVLGVLKAGGGYVPLDPDHPESRTAAVLADAAPVAIVTATSLRAALAGDPTDVPGPADPSHLAYVIYTSGSTGRPKGVAVEHGHLAAATHARSRFYPHARRFLLLSSLSFDSSVAGVFGTLTTGGVLVLATDPRDPAAVAADLVRHDVDTLLCVPSLYRELLPAVTGAPALTTVIVAGEVCPPELVDESAARLPQVAVVNEYGPTEATVWATAHRCEPGERPVPIGRPVANVRAYVLDARDRPAPVGVAGELVVGGAGVARGYLGRTEETRAGFDQDPFVPGGRVYRTGDLARRRADGALEFLGRADRQVKVRGHRVEPGEVETALATHVRESVVVARDDRLVAYVVGGTDPAVLRAALTDTLPAHLVPSVFVGVDALPRNPNGKVDHAALPAPDTDATTRPGHTDPIGRVERTVAAIWAEVLGYGRIGRHDSFFALGGHSLTAIRVVSRVGAALGVDAAVGTLLDHPVLADFARELTALAPSVLAPITPVPRGHDLPATAAQRGLWFTAQVAGADRAYRIGVALRLTGDLDEPALCRAMDALVARHETLRTTFTGAGRQRVGPPDTGFAWTADLDAPFDLATGPLVRGRLDRTGPHEWTLALAMHHIVSDAWSAGVLVRELSVLYAAYRAGEPDPLPPLPVQYADYAAWQTDLLAGGHLDRHAEHWVAALAGAPDLSTPPADRPRPDRPDHRGAFADVALDAELTARVTACALRHATTPFAVLFAAWAAVLSRLSDQPDVVVGVPSANRGRPETEDLIGFFVTMLPVRLDAGADPTAAQWLRQVHERVTAAQAHQDLPFDRIVELTRPARTAANHPLFQVAFTWQAESVGRLDLPGVTATPLPPAAPDAARFDLTLALAEVEGRIEGGAEYATALFDHATVERYLRCWRTLLAALVADDDTPVSRLALLTPAEEAEVVAAGTGPVRAVAGTTVHGLVEEWVRRTPDAVAVEHGADRFTYAELDARATRIAGRLRAAGVRADDRVGLLLPPGADLVAAVLGTLKAGAAYLPLDPTAPEARTAALLADAAPVVVLTEADLAAAAPADGASAAAPAVVVSPEHLAYVLYTSGSTGEPKGVLVEHANLLAMTRARIAEYGPLGRAVLAVPAHFDAAAAVLFGTLGTGGTLVVADHGVAGLAELVRDRRVSTLLCASSVLRAVLPGLAAPSLRLVLVGGEPLPPGTAADLARRHPDAVLVNEYGPTETTIWATCHRCVPGEPVTPVGRPVENARISVRDRHGVPVPFGVVGEVHIGGAGVARGYLNRPDLSTAAFTADPAGRRYRTGDLGRLRPDGVLELLGRADDQVKVRGVRIEPGEVERALLRHPTVAGAVVVARGHELVAYHVGAVAPEELRGHLAGLLPEHLVPAAYVALLAIPLTGNGKTDRAALPDPTPDAYVRRGHTAPEGEIEAAVAREWAELLGTNRIGRDDNFFDLGGHSLAAVTLVDRLRAHGLATTVTDVITTPSLRHLAATVVPAPAPAPARDRRFAATPAELAAVAVAATVPGGAANVLDVYPLAPLQEGVLYDHLSAGDTDPYLMSLTFAFDTRDRLDAHVRALQAAVDRHDILRTAVVWEDLPEPRQVVWRHAEVPVEEVTPDEVGRVPRIDVRRAPLLRLTVAADGDCWLLGLHLHHLAGDHATLAVLQRELAAHLTGRAGDLPEPVPFREFVDHVLATADPDADDAFFTALLGDVDEPTAPFGRRTAAGLVEHHTWLPADVAERLRRQTRRLGVGPAAAWHLALALVLVRLTDRADVVFGTVLSGRTTSALGAVGPFVNTLPLRITVDPTPARDAVRATHTLLAELLRHEHASLARAQRCGGVPAPEPLFTTLFNYRQDTAAPATGGPVAVVDGTAYPVTVSVDDSPAGFAVTTQAADAARVGGYLVTAVTELVAALETEDTPLYAVDVLPAAERIAPEAVTFPVSDTVHGLFDTVARARPTAVSVVDGSVSVTYAELAARANRVAHSLLDKGVRPGDRVGVSLPRGADLVAALLGVVKVGAAYVPLDPAYPAERLAFVTEDCGLLVVVDHVPADGPEHDPEVVVSPSDAAYVIYTSGSTGRPKGVVVEHRNVVRLFASADEWFGFGSGDVWSWCHSFAFDFSVWEVFGALTTGGRLVVIPVEVTRSPADLVALACRAGVTVLSQTPGAFREFVAAQDDEPHRLRHVVLGGEALDPAALGPWFARGVNTGVQVTNMYGITETTVHVTRHEVTATDTGCPVGTPLPDLRVYVLDRWGRPAPVGVVGEMYVGGAGVARGYHARPALTADRFVPDPFVPGERMYRTGDLAVRAADGSLTYVGRNDAQVKVRGFRVEPGEVEAVLTGHPLVRAAVVLLAGDVLVAYVVGDATAAELRAHASAALPEHLVPAAYVRVDRFPLTVNGKLDRAALPAPDAGSVARRDYEPPSGEVELALADIWAEVLGQERIGRHDSFFDLGGHSVLAVRLLSRVRTRFGVDLAVDTAFRAPTLADYAAEVADAAPDRRPPITPAARARPLPMSFAQRRLWFLSTMDGVSEAYHIDLNLRLSGELDESALRRAFDTVVARHEALRTTFAQDGEPVQVVAPAGRFTWTDETGPFDLGRGPLVRGRLVHTADQEWLLTVTMHHIVADGWSLGVLAAELSALYAAYRAGEADPLPPLTVQYPDYALWQHDWLTGDELKCQADFWQQTLHGAPELCELPTDRPRPARQDFAGAAVECVLDRELTGRLRALGARHDATLYMTVLATWAALLQRLSGQSEIVVGTPSANRGQREVEELIGFFVNMLPLRLDGSGAPTLAEWLARVRATTVAAQNNQELPFERIVELVAPTRSLAHNAVFQAAFAWQAEPEHDLVLPGVTVEPVTGARHTTSRFDLTLSLAEEDGEIRGGVEYATALFDRATVERFLGHWRTLVTAFVDSADAADETPVATLAVLTDAERERVVDAWNDTATDLPTGFLHDLVAAQAKRTPAVVAVVAGTDRLTYAELDVRADRLATHLAGLGVGPGHLVAVALERGVDLVVAVLGVLKSGAAYVPLDPAHPADRLRAVVADCDPVAVIAPDTPEWTDRPLVRPTDPGGPAAPPALSDATPDDLAYVIYTSGSTGTPKGVMISHAAACNTLLDVNARHRVGPADVVLALSSLSFDLSVYDLFGVLAAGGRVVLLPPGQGTDPVGWQELVVEHGVTLWNSVPALAQLFAESAGDAVFPSVRLVMMSGDWIPVHLPARLRACLPNAEQYSYGGATEVSIWSVSHPIDPAARYVGSVPYGLPLANQTMYVLDPTGAPSPVGVAGDLAIGGVGVALGYLNRPELTGERFPANPFHSGRMYLTGDRVRRRVDGVLEFLGRADFQVKLRGFRIELGDVESALLAVPEVRDAVVTVREDTPGDRRLVAYTVGTAEPAALRAALTAALPEYMVPTAYVLLDAFPLSANGKVDRVALPSPAADATATRGAEPPRGPVEIAIAGIWRDLLGVEAHRDDNFFALGGHSLLAVTLLDRMRAVDLHADVRTLFTTPTLADLAAATTEVQEIRL